MEFPAIVMIEIAPGWQQPAVRFAGRHMEAEAAVLWARVHSAREARLRVIDRTGEEFGTVLPHERHGVSGVRTERCAECAREFKTWRVGEALCPGCQLLLTGCVR